jgi:flagellar basal body-associated protein FliL
MDKKQKIIVSIFTAVVIIACVALVVFVRQRKQAGQVNLQGSGQNNKVNQNDANNDPEISAQLQALDELRKNSADTQPKTDGEKQAVAQTQLQQLDAIRKADNTPPPTQQQIDDQLKQLDALRNAAR